MLTFWRSEPLNDLRRSLSLRWWRDKGWESKREDLMRGLHKSHSNIFQEWDEVDDEDGAERWKGRDERNNEVFGKRRSFAWWKSVDRWSKRRGMKTMRIPLKWTNGGRKNSLICNKDGCSINPWWEKDERFWQYTNWRGLWQWKIYLSKTVNYSWGREGFRVNEWRKAEIERIWRGSEGE